MDTSNKEKFNNLKLQKPFIKWVGGKSQLIYEIMNTFPRKINNYHELFLGGGSVLLALLSLIKEGFIYVKGSVNAYDVNEPLIKVYKHIQRNKDVLYECVEEYVKDFSVLPENISKDYINRNPKTIDEAKLCRENYYYWLRKQYNQLYKKTDNTLKEEINCSALFLFINKTCFRGVYREGPNGFNVPYGHYKKIPNIITIDELNKISELIQDVNFIASDFRDSMKNICKGDFVYLDPPYVPENKKSFVKYVQDGFNLQTHLEFFNNLKNLKDVKFVMSNAKVDLVIEQFKEYNIKEIIAKRAINSKNPGSKTKEVIIYNVN